MGERKYHFRINREKPVPGKASATVSSRLDTNKKTIGAEFRENPNLICYQFETSLDRPAMLVYFKEPVDRDMLDGDIIRPLITPFPGKPPSPTVDTVRSLLPVAGIVQTHYMQRIYDALLEGKTVLFVENQKSALILPTAKWKTRPLSEPEAEVSSRGPRIGFVENLDDNKMLLLRVIRNPKLVMEDLTLGRQTQTTVCVAYIDGIVNRQVLQEVKKRLGSIDIDAILNSGYIEELIKDHPLSPFNTVGYSERPDTIAGKILEGRVAILCNGSPQALTVPFLFLENFQISEDYYNHFIIASIMRLVRILAFLLAVFVPGAYITLLCYHHELIPMELLLSLISARSGVPFPTIVELLMMLLVFDVIRESGLRLPRALGQTITIVGALVLGQAAVEAKFASAPVIIIVAIAAISSFIFFRIDGAIIAYRWFNILLSASFGMYGFLWGMVILLLNLVSMRSFGIAYMSYLGSFQAQEFKDTVIRAPWWYMYVRPHKIARINDVRKRNSQ